MRKLTLMAVFAHPDDEAFGVGGTLSRYAAEGHDVYLVTATRGEAGEIADGRLATAANLPQIRERELRCACATYGIHSPIFLDYVDGQLTIVHQGQAVGKIVHLIRELRPQVMISFGPDGIYGHYDHIAVHRWATIAYRLAASPDCFPDQMNEACKPHQVDKLYHHVLTRQQVAALSEDVFPPTVMMDGVPFPFVGYSEDDITTIIDTADYGETKLRGIRCHSTQIGSDSPFSGPIKDVIRHPFFTVEHFILAESTGASEADQEDDLLANL